MSDRLLLLHWNEISVPQNATPEDLETNPRWPKLARSAMDEFFKAQKLRPDVRISFSRGFFHGIVAERPFLSWLELWLGKERAQKLKGRAVQPMQQGVPPFAELDCELSVLGRPGEGVTRAHLADTWAWSLALPETGAIDSMIRADRVSVEHDQVTEVEVRNLASDPHAENWADEFSTWGQTVSANHVIAQVDGLLFIMYPLDHGHPHLHVHAQDDSSLNAKYRVDKFEALTSRNPAGLDAKMGAWIAEHRNALLKSWERCQAGKFPLKL
ncbi:hypothetical protein DBR47_09445 [Paucibacter sp. KBW04]|nr:hypothetical protein DBR47_09445 [Paucibacter sp. KBW04]